MSSILFANWDSFGPEISLLISTISASDLTTIPLFFVGEPVESTGFISIANVAGLPLNGGNFKINTPGTLVGFLSQSVPSFKNPASLSSVLILRAIETK